MSLLDRIRHWLKLRKLQKVVIEWEFASDYGDPEGPAAYRDGYPYQSEEEEAGK